MKRRPPILLKLIVFIVLGAIVNVAVAWGCAYAWIEADGPLVGINPFWNSAYDTFFVHSGLPMKALEGHERLVADPPNQGVTYRSEVRGMWVLAHPTATYLIPYDPIWPGFAINTIVYAANLWLFFAVSGMIRGRRRIKRGLCPACAYPVGRSNICTECGKPIPPTSRPNPST